MKISPALQKAVCNLSADQKNKILLELLSKNESYAQKLEFQLLNTLTVVELREKLFHTLDDELHNNAMLYTPGQLLMFLRDLYRKIETHAQLTGDTYGEVDLNIFVLNESLKLHSQSMTTFKYKQVETWCKFILAKTFKALLQRTQLTNKEQLELYPDLEELGHHYQNNKYLTRSARSHGLQLNWLLNNEVPNNLQEIHDGIKKLGYLQSRNPVKDRVKE
ncbi:hypothetical protein SAMN05216474_0110 [Lishizhenia tianjinensis]|uniref:Uncharacterized protein n=1 Tax=Lishizhenia tianjinensis TaxID=477690 RepID=A0A1I6XD18_9FLAO|nr:hypothetical protein [Lishizhenia tianjinensis]SFT36200.1 hypothetical protein SAMN05216474_0110 [Lishizhenia tianjinensis]